LPEPSRRRRRRFASGGVAGAVYTLSLIASGDYFSVAAVLWLIAVGFFVVLARRPIYRGRAT